MLKILQTTTKSHFYYGYPKYLTQIHTSSINLIGFWRLENNLEENPNQYGKLTNAPDFSYKDGRPAPLTIGQKKRLNQQKQFTQKAIQYLEEINFAVDRCKQAKLIKVQEKENILANKLKEKGQKKLN